MQPVRTPMFRSVPKPSKGSDTASASNGQIQADIERNLIAALVREPKAVTDIQLNPDDFTQQDLGSAFYVLTEMAEKNEASINFLTVAAVLNGDGKAAAAASVLALESLSVSGDSNEAAKVATYADIILKTSKDRQVISAAALVSTDPRNESYAADLNRALEIGIGAKSVVTSDDAVKEFIDYMKRQADGSIKPISTGLADLDRSLSGGFHAGQVIVLAARPSEGKSALAQGIAEHVSAANSGKRALFISLEMSTVEIMQRRIATASRGAVSLTSLRSGGYTEEELAVVQRILPALSFTGMEFLADSAESIEGIIATVRARSKKGDLGLVVIDYLQLIDSEGASDNREQQVAKVSRRLKQLAQYIKAPILLLSQMNRDSEKGNEKRSPRLTDLRESGSIEQDADVVLFIYDETSFEMRGKKPVQQKSIIIAKQRGGARDIYVPVAWLATECRFANMGYEREELPPVQAPTEMAQPVRLKSATEYRGITNERELEWNKQLIAAIDGEVEGIPPEILALVEQSKSTARARNAAEASASPFAKFVRKK